MLEKVFALALIGAAAHWFWNGPYQDMSSTSYEEQIEANAADMKRCIRSQEFVDSTHTSAHATAEQTCASKYKVYQEDGRWHRYEDTRPS